MKYFPLFISLEGKQVVVYGGGNVAARRIEGLLDFGARVQVIAPEISEKIYGFQSRYPGQMEIREGCYEPGQLAADFVLSCVDDRKVDEAIYRECKECNIPVNVASDQKLCDFFFPALVEQENLVIGISSGGKDHTGVKHMAARLRRWLSQEEHT